jgi:hypothetical protein
MGFKKGASILTFKIGRRSDKMTGAPPAQINYFVYMHAKNRGFPAEAFKG